MATYYIGADVHSNNTELAIEQRGRIVARYSIPTTIPANCIRMHAQVCCSLDKHIFSYTCNSPGAVCFLNCYILGVNLLLYVESKIPIS